MAGSETTHTLRISDPEGEGDATFRTVFVNDQKIGVITGFHTMFMWNPETPMPLGLDIEPSMSFGLEGMADFLEHIVDRQLAAIARGQKPDTNTLHPDLRSWIFEGPFGTQLKHPLIFELTAVPAMHARINQFYKLKRKEREAKLAKKDWRGYVWIHERAHRLDAFSEIEHHLNPVQYWEMLGSIWVDSENIYQNLSYWKAFWLEKRPQRHRAMDADDRKVLAGLPDHFEVYRGARHRKSIAGLSWTIDQSKAVWFARRYKPQGEAPYLAKTTVRKKDVLAYFGGRNESEIVIPPPKSAMIEVEVLDE